MPKNVQIRDLDDEVYSALRSQAAAENLSLTQYLRRELARLTSVPTMAAWLDRVDQSRRRHGGVSREALEQAVEEMRAARP